MQYKKKMDQDKEIDRLVEAHSILADMKSFDKESAKSKVFARTVNKRSLSPKRLLRIAAVLLLPVVCSFLTYLYVNDRTISIANNAPITITAPQCGVLEYLLPDSSRVWLSNGSKITYNAGLANGDVRKIKMNGEAFFDVKKNKNAPFIVDIAGIDVEVKGTQFNCIERSDVVEITLVEGVVEVRNEKDVVLERLTPNQQLVYNKNSKEYSLYKGVDCKQFTAWRDNELYFNDSDFSLVMERVSHFYRVEIVSNNDAFKNKKITAKFKNESIEDVVEILSAIAGGTYSIQTESGKKVITIK